MGVVAVRDVAYYLQYYSLPVITALLTPVVQLVLALKDIYWIRTHHYREVKSLHMRTVDWIKTRH